jgi:hypothetical protein
MADYLVYWQQYWEDAAQIPNMKPSKVWSTDSKALYGTVERTDNLWVVVTGGSDYPNEWRLLERIRVSYPQPELEESKWGRYHIVGDKRKSQVFSIQAQPDFTAILLLLRFASGKRINVLGKRIGQALQTHGFRKLSESDATLLEEYARSLIKASRKQT